MMARRHPAAPRWAAALLLALGLPQAARAAWGWNERKVGTIADGKFTPGRPPAESYGEDPALSCPDTTLARELQGQLQDLARVSGRPLARPDGRLCAAAEALLGWTPKEDPREEVLAFVSRYFGLAGTVRRYSNAVFPTEDGGVLAQRLLQPVGNFALNSAAPRYGFATQRLRKDSTRVVLLLQDAPYELKPFPRRLAPGASARLQGKLAGDLKNPALAISDVTGALSTPQVPAGDAFDAEVRCGPKAGRIAVDLSAEKGGSPVSVARFPVACGTDLPASVPVTEPDPWPPEPARQERRMLEAVNAERAAVGLKALAWDDGLAGVARSIAESIRDEVKRGVFDVPSDVGQRLKKAGIASQLVLVNPAQARTAQEAQAQLAGSPGHRQNYMNPEVNDAGMGIAEGAAADGSPAAFVTQIYIQELPPPDVAKVRDQLRAAVVRKRKDARQPSVTFDPALEAVAEKYAQELAQTGGTLTKERKAELVAPLNKGFKTVHVLAGAKADPLDFAEEPEVVSSGRSAGVGAAAGMHPTLGRNAVYAVILVGQKR